MEEPVDPLDEIYVLWKHGGYLIAIPVNPANNAVQIALRCHFLVISTCSSLSIRLSIGGRAASIRFRIGRWSSSCCCILASSTRSSLFMLGPQRVNQVDAVS